MIRKAGTNDISRISEILIFAKRTAYRFIFNNDKVSFGEMQVLSLANEYIENISLLDNIVVYDDEFVKGMANIIEYEDSKTVELKEIYIDPFFQGEGVGSKLLSYIIDKCKETNIEEIFLWVLEKNINAIKFYSKYGFLPNDERKLEEGTTEYIIKYCRKLNKC